jgi:hypothetical protein
VKYPPLSVEIGQAKITTAVTFLLLLYKDPNCDSRNQASSPTIILPSNAAFPGNTIFLENTICKFHY